MVQSLVSALVMADSRKALAPEWAAQAWIARLDESRCLGAAARSGALVGLRFAVKDNIDVAGVPTTAACPAFSYSPSQHATVVRRLLDSGATLTGKTNLDQFACGLNGTRSPYGAVPNAFNPAYVSGGSSAGSAYVVATAQVDFALGTDTAGSGRVPAGLNNIVGIKPSKGLISAHGVVPAAQSVDCVSIFARTVGVATRVLEAFPGSFGRSRVAAMTIGNPVRAEFFAKPAPAARLSPVASGRTINVLVIGGSQGALKLNAAVPSAMAELRGDGWSLAIRHQTGERWLAETDRHYRDACVPATTDKFIDDVASAYAAADLVICRAGALTVS